LKGILTDRFDVAAVVVVEPDFVARRQHTNRRSTRYDPAEKIDNKNSNYEIITTITACIF
jgi:hypothetical protein